MPGFLSQELQLMPRHPWDPRPAASVGDLSEDALFSAVGRSLTEWENVETECAELFAVLVSARKKSVLWVPAIRAYGSIVSFTARCEMLRQASLPYFHTRNKKKLQFEDKFKSLINEVLQYAGRRNEIAHGQVTKVFSYRRGGSKSDGYYLIPSLFNPKKFKFYFKVILFHKNN